MKSFVYNGVLLIILSLLTVQVASASTYDVSVAQNGCHAWRNPFVLNKANVNALLAITCTSLSHNQNERKHMIYDDSATMFHQWSTVSSGAKIYSEGYCSVPYPDLKSGEIEKYKINLSFENIIDKDGKEKLVVGGHIAGRSLELEFSQNEFIDQSCSPSEVKVNKLQHIRIGLGLGMKYLFEMLNGDRTGVILNLLETEHWVQGSASGYFSSLGVQYQLVQANGRRLGVAIAPSPSGSLLNVRSANVLEYYDGSDYFDFNYDSFGIPAGFKNESYPTNSKFQAYPIANGSQLVGCSSLIYEGELDRPSDVDIENCKRRVSQSVLKLHAKPIHEPKMSPEQIEAIRLKDIEANLSRKIESYIKANYGPYKKYSSKPYVYETGRASWKKEDIARGYVVYQRSIDFDHKNKKVHVVEFRYNALGLSSKHTYDVLFSSVL